MGDWLGTRARRSISTQARRLASVQPPSRPSFAPTPPDWPAPATKWLREWLGLRAVVNKTRTKHFRRMCRNPQGNQALGAKSPGPDPSLSATLTLTAALILITAAPIPGNPEPAKTTPMNRIRAARQALGGTQNDLAKKANVSPRTIHAVEKGRLCRQATKRHILNALGVPWELRDEYFVRARSVRPTSMSNVREVRTAS